jgi:hypothetical protein
MGNRPRPWLRMLRATFRWALMAFRKTTDEVCLVLAPKTNQG